MGVDLIFGGSSGQDQAVMEVGVMELLSEAATTIAEQGLASVRLGGVSD
jgi:hypothetical protein